MADPRYPYWITEQSPTHRGPTSGILLRLAVFALLVAICWSWFSTTEGGAAQVDRKAGVSLCEEHRGDSGWTSVCGPGPAARRR